MKHELDLVADFHEKFGQENGKNPRNLNIQQYLLRYKLIEEESKEYLDACGTGDLVGVADALGDQLYILLGTILKHGMQDVIEEVFAEIHRSNLSKLDADGKPIFREDGKILKSERYFKPDIGSILINKMAKEIE